MNLLQKVKSYFETNKSNIQHIDYSDMLDSYSLNKRLISYSIQERSSRITSMTGVEFEDYIKDLFSAKGIRCESTPVTGDYGVDLIAHLNSKKIAIQCKRYKDRVGFSAVQEVYTGKDLYGCTEGWVVTNSSFSRQALESSKKLKIKLVNVCHVLDQIQLAN